VAQIQTAGLGITLTAGSVNHFYSCSHSFGDYDQALARTDRYGQTIKVTNKHLLADLTCDVEVLRALRRKRNVADAVVDGMWRNLIEGRSFVSVDEFDA
jgi:SNF2 family DNA or RNA helicase